MIPRVKLPRRRTLLAGGSAAAIVLGGGLALDAVAASAQSVNAQQEVSQNWSGYVVADSAGQSFSSVSGSWVQPAASSSSTGQGDAAFWVGLGGAGEQSQSLEQVGTAAEDVDGQTSYYAWYELVPASQVKLDLTIHPGDQIAAKVSVGGTNVTISLTDQTTGQSVTKALQMADPDTSSAEWIAEAPAAEFGDGSLEILPLADFGKVTFTNASATAGDESGSISDSAFTAAAIDMDNAAGGGFVGAGSFGPAGLGGGAAEQSDAGATTSTVSDSGTSFTVSYSSSAADDQYQDAGADGASSYTGGGYPGYSYGSSGYGYGGGGYGYGYGYGSPGYGGYGYGGYGYSGYAYAYPGYTYLQ